MESLNWLPKQHQHHIHDLQIFHQIQINMLNASFLEILLSSTRNPLKYKGIQCLHSEAFKNRFFVRTVQIWNSLPSEIMDCTKEDKFRVSVTEWLRPCQWVKVVSTSTWTLVQNYLLEAILLFLFVFCYPLFIVNIASTLETA